MPRSTLTWKKNIWKFNCSTSRPFQKGSVYKLLPIFEVCIFISKTELWKNTAPARRSCLLAHVEPFFHFQNSVGDCIYCTRNPDQVQDKGTATSNITDNYGQPRTVTKSRKSPPVALLRYKAKRHMATTPPLQTPMRHAACPGRPQQFQTDSYGTCRRRHESHAISATPATQSAATCLQVLCLPLKVQLHVAKCHACHAKRRGATAPHLKPSPPPEPAQCHKCHACHAKCSYMSPSAVPATQSAATCRQVPRLPRKTPRRHGKTKRATRASPVP